MKAVAAAVLLLAAATGGCAASADGGTPAPPPAEAAEAAEATQPTQATQDASAEAGPGGLSPTDLAWVQLMMPMDDQIGGMLALAPERAADPGVRKLAARLAPDCASELDRLRTLFRRTGLPETNVHEGHDMPGMLNPEEQRALRAATGPEFDQLVLRNLREYLEQSARLAQSEQQAGGDAAVRALAGSIGQARPAQLAALDRAGG